MLELGAFSSLALTIGLALWRPHVGHTRFQVGPGWAALAGVAAMLLIGAIGPSDARTAINVLWRPLLAMTSIMIITGAALRLGSVDRAASAVLPRARHSAPLLFIVVLALSAVVAAVLNNDSAVLLLTPLVVTLVWSLYPDRADLAVPFAFAVFMAAGVAPLVTSNPMNLIVADYAGLDFNEYALRMLPVAITSWIVTAAVLFMIFRRQLAGAPAPPPAEPLQTGWSSSERHGVALVLVVLGGYPVVAYLGGSVWLVAGAGAIAAAVLCARHQRAAPAELVRRSVAWEILVFLFGVFLLAIGLRNAGIVEQLTSLYERTGDVTIGAVSALGSALINNHSMALTNLLAIRDTAGSDEQEYLAALTGGDLGPRLLPMGSLAGLLWYASLRRLEVHVPVKQFALVGVAVTIPSLAASLAVLALTG